MTTTELCFSNGTEFMTWQSINCDRCVKAVWYNEKTDTHPMHRCSIQRDIEMQAAGLYEISKRSYNAAQMTVCPFIRTERKPYKKKRIDKNQMKLEL